jgi:hypothetical protein
MYNPFPLLTPGLLNDQLARDKRYFVRQTFARGMDSRLKAAFLLRAYGAEEKAAAGQHMAAITRDANIFLYDASLPEHMEKLRIAATQPFGYKIFYAAKKGVDWKPPALYQEKIKHYIRIHHSDWQTNRGGAKIQAGLYEEFGELFLKFSSGEQQETIPFDDIEKY